MKEQDPDIVTSGLSRRVIEDGITVQLHIYRLATETEWALEVVNAAGTSTVWQDLFLTAEAANEEFLRTVDVEGMSTFLDSAKVVPFRR